LIFNVIKYKSCKRHHATRVSHVVQCNTSSAITDGTLKDEMIPIWCVRVCHIWRNHGNTGALCELLTCSATLT